MISDVDLNDFNRDVQAFNEIAGKDKDTSLADLKEQFQLIAEEVKELEEALLDNKPIEVLDGAIDVLVTTLGLMQKLQNRGFNVALALSKTGQNNLSKFVPDMEMAVDTVKFYKDRHAMLTKIHEDMKYRVFAILDENNKVRKPLGFKPNNLEDCVPDEVKEKGL